MQIEKKEKYNLQVEQLLQQPTFLQELRLQLTLQQ